MKKERIRQLFGKSVVKAGTMMLAAAVVLGSGMWYEQRKIAVPELVSYVDMEDHIQVIEEDVPLAGTKVTKSVKTTNSTKKVKMSKKSKKTYNKKGATKKKTTTKKTSTSKATTTTKTEKATTVTEKFKKGSNIKTQLTTVKTTVTKTVVEKQTEAKKQTESKKKTTEKTSSAEVQTKPGTYQAAVLAPKADRRLLEAYEKLGFKVTVTPNVPYSGYFNARDQLITLRKVDSTIYHELGHFLGFIAGNMDESEEFKAVFNNEKSKYTGRNKTYILSNSAEYFAESYLNYVENPAALKAERPQTFAAIEAALNKVTTDRVDKIWNVYSVIWSR